MTPERWYVLFWVFMGAVYLALQTLGTYWAVRLALTHWAHGK